jgi:hypothetical protein
MEEGKTRREDDDEDEDVEGRLKESGGRIRGSVRCPHPL